jgi:hypothetical protein
VKTLDEAKIVVGVGSLRPGTVGPATADICLVLDDDSFPMPGWNDFAIVILSAFVEAVLRLRRGASRRETVRFMNGPFRVELEVSPDGGWIIELAAEDDRDVGRRSQIDPSSFVESLGSASNELLDACPKLHCWTRDEEALQRLLPSLWQGYN